MTHDRSFSEVHLDIEPGHASQRPSDAVPRDDDIFRLAICGDFCGRGGSTARHGDPPRAGQAWRVDRDEFDAVLADAAPTLRLVLSSDMTVDVQIRELDDFHPDQLFERVPQFARLRALRARLLNASTFGDAAAELAAPPRPTSTSLSSANLLDAIVGDTIPNRDRESTDDLYAFIQRSMAPYLVARPDPRQAELVAQVDGALSAALRALLHHPEFQALEALWRGVFRLVRDVDTGEQLQIHLFDITRDELAQELRGARSSRPVPLVSQLEATAPRDDGGWRVIVAHFAFAGSTEGVAVLETLAGLASTLGAACLAEALPDLAMGDLPEAAAPRWQQLRASPSASALGLALPRVLLRLPFGKDSDEIEHFAFEELEATAPHGSFLWGNPALFCAGLLATEFSEANDDAGRARSTRPHTAISGLPLYVYRHDGETVSKSCAEIIMTEDDAMALLSNGFIPMCALRDQDVVQVPRVQSIAEPATRLSGR
jgi:type VI secretion system protein ImpC